MGAGTALACRGTVPNPAASQHLPRKLIETHFILPLAPGQARVLCQRQGRDMQMMQETACCSVEWPAGRHHDFKGLNGHSALSQGRGPQRDHRF